MSDLPVDTDSIDAAFSTMTYYEFANDDAFAEINRVLALEGRLVIVDWTATGTGDAGPPLDERFTAPEAADALSNSGFRIEHEAGRPEPFLLVATAK